LLIVRDLVSGPRRFVELQRTLPGISTEQLRSRLNRMVADGLLTRQRYREVPPRVDYELTERARDLVPVLGALARWGYEWSWTKPRRGEAIDIGAIFRLAPGLLTLPRSLRGTVELTVSRRSKDGETRQYVLTVKRGDVTLQEGAAADADAHIAGTERAWIDALVPEGTGKGLEVRGDASLANAVLEGLAPGSTRASAVA
jgi:DNA-binding HxlR family transcriptional regulator